VLPVKARIDAEAARPSKEDCRKNYDVEPDKFYMPVREKRTVMHQEKRRQQIDQDEDGGRARGKAQDDKYGTDAIAEKRKGQTRMSAYMDGIREVLHHGGIAGEFLQSVLQEQAEAREDAQNEQTDAYAATACICFHEIFDRHCWISFFSSLGSFLFVPRCFDPSARISLDLPHERGYYCREDGLSREDRIIDTVSWVGDTALGSESCETVREDRKYSACPGFSSPKQQTVLASNPMA